MACTQVDLHLGRAVRHRRRLLGMSQTDVGRAIGVRFQQIQKYECAANSMSAARLWQIAGALQADVASFYAGLVYPNKTPTAR